MEANETPNGRGNTKIIKLDDSKYNEFDEEFELKKINFHGREMSVEMARTLVVRGLIDEDLENFHCKFPTGYNPSKWVAQQFSISEGTVRKWMNTKEAGGTPIPSKYLDALVQMTGSKRAAEFQMAVSGHGGYQAEHLIQILDRLIRLFDGSIENLIELKDEISKSLITSNDNKQNQEE